MSEKAPNMARILLYVSDEMKATFTDAAAVSGQSLSGYIGDILSAVEPQVRQMAEAQRLVKKNPALALSMLQRAGNQSQSDLLDVLNEASDKMVDLSSKPKKRGRGRPKKQD